MTPSRPALLLAFLCGSGCLLSFDDVLVRKCDAQQLCREGKVCVNGSCLDRSSSDGGSTDIDAGIVDPLPSDAGPMPNGTILWSQARDGFDGQFADSECSVAIDANAKNRVDATVVGSSSRGDSAVGDVTRSERFPKGNTGRVRGKITLPAALQTPGKLTFLYLDDSTQTPSRGWLSIGMTPDKNLVVLSVANSMSNAEIKQTIPISSGFPAGTYAIDVQWQLGGSRQVAFNGRLVNEVALPAPSATPLANRLRLGIRFVEGEDGGMTSLSASDWEMTDTPSALGAFP